eukprot:1683570-Karenia_brevis.AAC.1
MAIMEEKSEGGSARLNLILTKSQKIWDHGSIDIKRKKELFEAFIISKLRYRMESICLRKYERHRLNAFYSK